MNSLSIRDRGLQLGASSGTMNEEGIHGLKDLVLARFKDRGSSRCMSWARDLISSWFGRWHLLASLILSQIDESPKDEERRGLTRPFCANQLTPIPLIRCSGGYTATHGACWSGSRRILRAVLEAGADTDITDCWRMTPV